MPADPLSATIALPLWSGFLAFIVLVALLAAVWKAGAWTGYRRRLRAAREGSRRALSGSVAEQWAPLVEGFPGRAVDARFMGAPIDYLVFDGLSEGSLREVIFVEIKSGKGRLSPPERALRDCIREGRVRWELVQVDAPDSTS